MSKDLSGGQIAMTKWNEDDWEQELKDNPDILKRNPDLQIGKIVQLSGNDWMEEEEEVRRWEAFWESPSPVSAMPKTSEKDFGSQVEYLLSLFGWRWTHSRPARTDKGWRTAISGDAGFEDYVAVRPPRVAFIELKSETGKEPEAQAHWRKLLEQCPGVERYLFRPRDLPEIVKVLQYPELEVI